MVRSSNQKARKMSDETRFPESYNEWQVRPTYNIEKTRNWFKRCLADFPYGAYPIEEWATLMEQWFERWFSQFSSKGEEVKE